MRNKPPIAGQVVFLVVTPKNLAWAAAIVLLGLLMSGQAGPRESLRLATTGGVIDQAETPALATASSTAPTAVQGPSPSPSLRPRRLLPPAGLPADSSATAVPPPPRGYWYEAERPSDARDPYEPQAVRRARYVGVDFELLVEALRRSMSPPGQIVELELFSDVHLQVVSRAMYNNCGPELPPCWTWHGDARTNGSAAIAFGEGDRCDPDTRPQPCGRAQRSLSGDFVQDSRRFRLDAVTYEGEPPNRAPKVWGVYEMEPSDPLPQG